MEKGSSRIVHSATCFGRLAPLNAKSPRHQSCSARWRDFAVRIRRPLASEETSETDGTALTGLPLKHQTHDEQTFPPRCVTRKEQ